MRFIIYTSLASLILMFFYLFVIRKAYKKYKNSIKPVIHIASEGLTCAMNGIGSIAYALSSEIQCNTFKELLDKNENNIKRMEEVAKNEKDKEKIITKSKEYEINEYYKIMDEFKKIKLYSIENEDDDLLKTIIEYSDEIEKTHNLIIQKETFVTTKILVDFIANRI